MMGPDDQMATSKSLLLTKLPPELRLKIYEFVLCQDEPIQLTYIEASRKLLRTRPLPLGPLTCLNLLLVCHQIRQESLSVFTSTNDLKIVTPILGQYLQLVQGNPLCSEVLPTSLGAVQTWLEWAASELTRIDVHVGTVYSWWEKASARVIAPAVTSFYAAVRSTPGSKVRMTVRMTVNWSAIPSTRSAFEVELCLWDLVQARQRLYASIETQKQWVLAQTDRSCLLENINSCQSKFGELFEALDGSQWR
ncbi:hypothetical protein Slin15195_G032620 [Septoria linicola]|uniref:F-box domain-containing protein n=1 Tax=Septoria linicola TaxID=215465 RepID=A0A9Q9AN06_9PEZI|nr:hypothetical protein Slin14017_G031650 [Septoria linicola]USW49943.1 hypothetical protein Slin15195_G032620 [Septoria linicola]